MEKYSQFSKKTFTGKDEKSCLESLKENQSLFPMLLVSQKQTTCTKQCNCDYWN